MACSRRRLGCDANRSRYRSQRSSGIQASSNGAPSRLSMRCPGSSLPGIETSSEAQISGFVFARGISAWCCCSPRPTLPLWGDRGGKRRGVWDGLFFAQVAAAASPAWLLLPVEKRWVLVGMGGLLVAGCWPLAAHGWVCGCRGCPALGLADVRHQTIGALACRIRSWRVVVLGDVLSANGLCRFSSGTFF